MKRLIAILLLTLFVSCDTYKGETGTSVYFLRSFVVGYIDGPLEVKDYRYDEKARIRLDLQSNPTAYYSIPGYGLPQSKEDSLMFEQIARRNNDRTYDREDVNISFWGRICYFQNFKEIHVVCLDGQWDAAHPAGASLDDVAKTNFYSFGGYVRRGYTEKIKHEKSDKIEKPLSKLTEEDLFLLAISHEYTPQIYFDTHPASGSYSIEVTMITTEGIELRDTCRLVF